MQWNQYFKYVKKITREIYLLLVQIADIIIQLFEEGYELIRSLKAGIKEISSRLLESFRQTFITVEDIKELNKHIQIRYL